jgi:hypothetical protein
MKKGIIRISREALSRILGYEVVGGSFDSYSDEFVLLVKGEDIREVEEDELIPRGTLIIRTEEGEHVIERIEWEAASKGVDFSGIRIRSAGLRES